jgi:hypothetical protein
MDHLTEDQLAKHLLVGDGCGNCSYAIFVLDSIESGEGCKLIDSPLPKEKICRKWVKYEIPDFGSLYDGTPINITEVHR